MIPYGRQSLDQADIDAVVEDVVWVVEESSANSEEAEGGEIFTAIPTWGMKKVGG